MHFCIIVNMTNPWKEILVPCDGIYSVPRRAIEKVEKFIDQPIYHFVYRVTGLKVFLLSLNSLEQLLYPGKLEE